MGGGRISEGVKGFSGSLATEAVGFRGRKSEKRCVKRKERTQQVWGGGRKRQMGERFCENLKNERSREIRAGGYDRFTQRKK